MTWDDRVKAIADHGFTERQASFLVTVMLHSGVCLGRNYSAYARIAHGGATVPGSVIRMFSCRCPWMSSR